MAWRNRAIPVRQSHHPEGRRARVAVREHRTAPVEEAGSPGPGSYGGAVDPQALTSRWDWLLAVRPLPGPPVVLTAAIVAVAGVALPRVWRRTRHVVTIAHEGGHAVGALLTGRRLAGIRLHSDTSGLTVSVGRPGGIGMALTLIVGYLAPSALGLAAAALLAGGRVTATLVGALLLFAGVLLQIRNAFGAVLLLLAGGAVLSVLSLATAAVQAFAAYTLGIFLIAGGIRPVVELARTRRHSRLRTSDADQLARITRVPAPVWVGVFGLGVLALSGWGAQLLLPVG